jgi:hypothetical protein
MLNNRGVLNVGSNWRLSWTQSWIAQNAQWCQGGTTQILNLDILSFYLIPRTKYRQHLRVPPKMWVSLPDYEDVVKIGIFCITTFLLVSWFRFLLRPTRSHHVFITHTATRALRLLSLNCALITFLLRLERLLYACTTHLSRSAFELYINTQTAWGYNFIYSSQHKSNMSQR